MRSHARQFVIGPRALRVGSDWTTRPLGPGLVLSHCPSLPVGETAHGLVIGTAIPTDGSDTGPSAWSGRWVLVADGVLQLDAGGLLGCFRRIVGDEGWLSSSLELLRSMDPALPLGTDPLVRDWRIMDWHPPPHSAVVGVSRLLPSQSLELRTGELRRVPVPRPVPHRDAQEALERVRTRLRLAMERTAELAAHAGGEVWLGLTAGHDSRVILAAAVDAGIDLVTYTFIRAETSAADRELPPQLAAAVGRRHLAIELGPVDPEREALFDRQTARGYAGGPRTQFSRGGWDGRAAGSIVLEGGCFEIGRAYYYDRLARQRPPTATAMTDAIVSAFPTGHPDGVRAWAEWVAGDPDDQLDWRDRFYLEQRIGGWLSAGLQGFDLTGLTMLHLANERGIMTDLLGFSTQERRASLHETSLVGRMAPVLASFPYAPGGHARASASRRPRP